MALGDTESKAIYLGQWRLANLKDQRGVVSLYHDIHCLKHVLDCPYQHREICLYRGVRKSVPVCVHKQIAKYDPSKPSV